jgi:hypothetical protein
MLPRFDFQFVFGVLLGVSALVWSAISLISLSHSPSRNTVSYYRGAGPVTQVQLHWGIALLGALIIAYAFASRKRQ